MHERRSLALRKYVSPNIYSRMRIDRNLFCSRAIFFLAEQSNSFQSSAGEGRRGEIRRQSRACSRKYRAFTIYFLTKQSHYGTRGHSRVFERLERRMAPELP